MITLPISSSLFTYPKNDPVKPNLSCPHPPFFQQNTSPPTLNRDKLSFGTIDQTQSATGPLCSYFFRSDIHYARFASFLDQRFPDGAEIRIEACSDGSEAYTLALALISTLGEDKAQKFFPIKCFDPNEEIITQAKEGVIGISYRDSVRFQQNLPKVDLEKYFQKLDPKEYPPEDLKLGLFIYKYRVKAPLDKYVTFEKRDILQDSHLYRKEKHEHEDTVWFMSNFIHVVDPTEAAWSVENIARSITAKSLVVIGSVELKNPRPEFTEEFQKHFVEVPNAPNKFLSRRVYEKKQT